MGFMRVFSSGAGCSLRPNPRQLLLTGVGALAVSLPAVGADGGYSPLDLSRMMPVPVSAEQHDRDEGEEGVAKSQSHGSDSQEEAQPAEKTVDNNFLALR